jgi:hypothetical protein
MTRRLALVAFSLVLTPIAVVGQQPNPRQQPGAAVTVFAPEQHDLYDGHFVLSANRIYMVGGLNDAPGWDHMDNAAATLRPASGTAEIDVDEIKNTGTFVARLKIPEGNLELAAGASATPRSTASRSIRTSRCTSWSRRACATARR